MNSAHFYFGIKILGNIAVVLLFILSNLASANNENFISLDGEWKFALDSLDIGITDRWYEKDFENIIQLPGTLDDAGVGKPSALMDGDRGSVFNHLARKNKYVGSVWYLKEIEIPEEWKGMQIKLKLERVLWESRVWINGIKAGKDESLSTPHQYAISDFLDVGANRIVIRIDNSDRYPGINVKGSRYDIEESLYMAHAYTNHTQIMWNGIIGNIQLIAKNKTNISASQIYPHPKENKISVKAEINNSSNDLFNGYIKMELFDADGRSLDTENIRVKTHDKVSTIEFEYYLHESIKKWDEFNPNVYDIEFSLYQGNQRVENSHYRTSFGVSNLSRSGRKLMVNDQRIFLRGTLECLIFPLSGYPPMTTSEWEDIIYTAKSFGLNHFRFHSWTPPKAAFEAADEAGFYFQVELPLWNLNFGNDPKALGFLYREAERIVMEYGNHPSFILMALGNEVEGDLDKMNEFVKHLKELDSRRLYTTTSFSFQHGAGTIPQPEDEFFISQRTEKGWVRGQGYFNEEPPNFSKNYTKAVKHLDLPIISHEIGQYAVYPDMDEISKYTGVLVPKNFMSVKQDLESKDMLHLAEGFLESTVAFANILYKEEIERALKTPELDGFQLLQLHDFPGQGTAIVGLLNAFWEPKPGINSEEFRNFSGPVVPLIRYEKALYTNDETFTASVEVANFYQELEDLEFIWRLIDEQGSVLTEQSLGGHHIHVDNAQQIAGIEYPLNGIIDASKLRVEIEIENTEFKNSWDIWVYPAVLTNDTGNVLITNSFEKAREALTEGKTVLLNPELKQIKGIDGRFVPVFWSPVHFPDQPGTMGLKINPHHPVFDNFPTDFHSHWNWWGLINESKTIRLNPKVTKPLIRVVDNFVRNDHLSNLFETNVGEGKLIFSSMDLHSDLEKRPEARQLRYSILEYMKSTEFLPSVELSFDELLEYKVSE